MLFFTPFPSPLSTSALRAKKRDPPCAISSWEAASAVVNLPPNTTGANMVLAAGHFVCTQQGPKVESLIKGILQDIELLANNRALDEATRDKMKARIEMNVSAQNDVVPSSGTCPSPPATQPRPPMSYHQPSVFRNYGTGTQNVHSGRGNQNINSGQGYFFSGTVTGPIHFSTAASC
ncbi:hypothetical protein N0V85_009706 [Neurospora sp. IMI 360204]|nr:hypothetical protein N0V85_009706 [Neurospora sp. IMI 360204]